MEMINLKKKKSQDLPTEEGFGGKEVNGFSTSVFQVLKQIRWSSDWSSKGNSFFYILLLLYKDPTRSDASNLTNGEYQNPWPMCRAVGSGCGGD
jgi:hypothetical protein